MKKIRIAFLIVAAVMLFASCISKQDIAKLNDTKDDLEDEYTEISDQIDSITDDIDNMTNEITEIENEKIELNEKIESQISENQELKAEIPVPPLFFQDFQFAFHLSHIYDEEKIGKDYDEKAWTDPTIEKTKDEITEEVYVLEGDIDTDEYLYIKYYSHYDLGILYSIVIEYSSEKYLDEYEDLITLAGPALIMICESPYYYHDEYFDRGQDIIEEGSYMEGLIKIVQEETDTGEYTKIYAEN